MGTPELNTVEHHVGLAQIDYQIIFYLRKQIYTAGR